MTISGAPADRENTIPALTLWQPWASFVAQGLKRVETRSWSTNYRGLLGIHAAVSAPSIDPARRGSQWKLCLRALGDLSSLPRGRMVAIVRLAAVGQITPSLWEHLTDREIGLGHYGIGRFAWCFDGVYPLREPIPAKGRQRLWAWRCGAELIEAADAAIPTTITTRCDVTISR